MSELILILLIELSELVLLRDLSRQLVSLLLELLVELLDHLIELLDLLFIA